MVHCWGHSLYQMLLSLADLSRANLASLLAYESAEEYDYD